MSRTLSALVFGMTVLCCGTPFACEPVVHQVADYAGGRIPDHAVFVGRVASVEEHRFKDGTAQRIRMTVVKWLSGAAAGSSVTVRGATGTYAGTDCAGQFDFSAKVGQQWLIFGQRGAAQGKDEVSPDTFLSRPAPDGRVAPEVLRTLAKAGR